jgi:hypothetical protein
MTATLALLTCLVCSLVETFDTWDHTLQSGNDTEYALVILALCVGVAFSFARFISKCSLRGLLVSVCSTNVRESFQSALCRFAPLRFDEISPPAFALRI